MLHNDIKVLIADDHALTRAGVIEYLNKADMNNIIEAKDGAEALVQIDRHKPDIILLDIKMPKVDGLTILYRLKERAKSPKVIMFTLLDMHQYILTALRNGARGFVLKTAMPKDLIDAINVVYKGGIYLHPEVSDIFNSPTYDDEWEPIEFTPKELEVFKLVACGYSAMEIGKFKGVSYRTIQTHMESIYQKLNVHNKTAAVFTALKYGIISVNELIKETGRNEAMHIAAAKA